MPEAEDRNSLSAQEEEDEESSSDDDEDEEWVSWLGLVDGLC